MFLQIATRTQFLCFLVLGLSAVDECLEHRTSKCGFHPSTGQTCTAEADTSNEVTHNLPSPLFELGSQDKVAIPLMEEAEMEGPMTLVENVDGTLHLNPDAVDVLRTIELPVVVVAVAGAARTGKSYLLNRLAKSKKGFSLGSTVQSQTKGIWMWSLPHPRRVDQRLILLDTEGLGDPEKGDEHNDNSVLSLAILLSSMFVYNSRGTIDQQAMAKLHFVTELAKRIQVKSQSNETEERNFVQFFPDFVWTLRDMTLDLVINESEVTADEYLENSLRLRKDESDQNMDYNALRRCIRDYFLSRRCFAFVCPATRKELKNIQEMTDDQLDPDFVREFHEFSEYVYNNGKVKKVLGGHKVTGKRLSQLVETYVAAIARGDLPCVESGIARMADLENEDAVQRALDYYDRKLTDLLELPAHIVYRLTDLFTFYHNEAVRIFITHSLMDNSGKHIKKLEETLQFRYKTEISKIENGSRNHCNKVLSELKASVVENLDSGLYLVPGGYFALDTDLDKVINEYNEQTLQEVKGLDVLAQFLETVKPRLAEVQKVGSMLHEKGEHMSALKEQLSKAEEQRRARQQQSKAVEGARKEDLVRQMKGKFEDEKEQLIAEQTNVIDHKLEEGERYSSEGSEEDRKRNEEESKYYKQEREKAESGSFWDLFRNFISWLEGVLFS